MNKVFKVIVIILTAIIIIGIETVLAAMTANAITNRIRPDNTIEETFVTESTTTVTTIETTNATTETTTEITTACYEVADWESLPGDLCVKVNLSGNTVTAYKGDTPIKAMICSTGYYTEMGTFKTSDRYRWHTLVGGVQGQYTTRFFGKILFHSVPYYYQNVNSLCTEEYNKLGTTCSHGCIRLRVADAKWIYDNCVPGTTVIVYDDPNSCGPLGKPDFVPIPLDQTWDPTDPEIAPPEIITETTTKITE